MIVKHNDTDTMLRNIFLLFSLIIVITNFIGLEDNVNIVLVKWCFIDLCFLFRLTSILPDTCVFSVMKFNLFSTSMTLPTYHIKYV